MEEHTRCCSSQQVQLLSGRATGMDLDSPKVISCKERPPPAASDPKFLRRFAQIDVLEGGENVRPFFQQAVDVSGEMNIMHRDADIIGQNPLTIIFTSGRDAAHHVADLCKGSEFRKVLEVIHMTGVVCEHLIEEKIAVGKATCVYRNDQNAFIEAVVRTDVIFKISSAGDDQVRPPHDLVDTIYDAELQVRAENLAINCSA